MSSGLGDLTAQANQLVAAGDLAAAQELLDNALSAADPSPSRASAELADAAALHARVLMMLGEPHTARGWAAFAYSAFTRLHGPSDPRTVAAAATLAAILHKVGSHARAGRLYREVIIELTATDGPESLRVLAAHADLATVEYARGECDVARERLQDAWELHREVYGDGHPSGIKMLARLGAMQRDCGLTEGWENLALARELCRQHLPADHPLSAQIAALAEAPPDPRHVCATPPESEEAAQSQPRQEPPDQPSSPPRLSGSESARQESSEEEEPELEPPGFESPWPESPWQASAAPAQPPLPPSVSGFVPTAPVDAPVDPPGQPVSPPGRPADAPGWSTDGPGWSTDGQAAGDPHRPADGPGRPPVTEESAGVYRMSALPVPREPARLPVHVPRASRAPQRRLTPAVFIGLLAAVLGAIIVVAGVTLVSDPVGGPPERDAPSPAGPTGSPAATSSPAAAPGAPPTEVRLRDGRDQVTLTWTYPPGAAGPLLISAGRSSKDLRAVEELPAGTTEYVVSDLDPRTNFCFSVAVVYSVDTIGRSDPVCTRRPGASGG